MNWREKAKHTIHQPKGYSSENREKALANSKKIQWVKKKEEKIPTLIL